MDSVSHRSIENWDNIFSLLSSNLHEPATNYSGDLNTISFILSSGRAEVFVNVFDRLMRITCKEIKYAQGTVGASLASLRFRYRQGRAVIIYKPNGYRIYGDRTNGAICYAQQGTVTPRMLANLQAQLQIERIPLMVTNQPIETDQIQNMKFRLEDMPEEEHNILWPLVLLVPSILIIIVAVFLNRK